MIDAREALDGRVPATVMTVEKQSQAGTRHPTPKPVALCEHLIRLFSADGRTVLDPFAGSRTTCLAALRTGTGGIGIDISSEYIDMARERLAAG